MTEPTTNERNWVWYSTVESAAAGKISVLAVSETLLRYLFRIRGALALFTMGVSLHLVATQMIDWSLVKAALDELQLLPGIAV